MPEEGMLQIWQGGRVVAEKNSMATNIPGVFAGGDAVTGPASIIEAIAAGKKAAVGIDCYLAGKPYPVEAPAPRIAEMDDSVMKFHLREVEKEERALMPMLDIEARKDSFQEVHLGLEEKEAVREARRCLTCRISAMRY
jgi:NADPH-dependent glutamate synthase beta subunit-like oxidoreductase